MTGELTSEEWFYQAFGSEYGPVGADELATMAKSGDLTPESLVRTQSMEDWIPIHQAFPKQVKREIKERRSMRAPPKLFACPHCETKTVTGQMVGGFGPIVCSACGKQAALSPRTKVLFFITLLTPTALLLLWVFVLGGEDLLDEFGIGGRMAKAIMFGSMGFGYLFSKVVTDNFVQLVKA